MNNLNFLKILFLLLSVGVGTVKSFGQITSPNWTLNDCASNSHTLYNYLDSQEVVVMEFAMGCASCTQAAGHLMNLKEQYAMSHPGKVNFFYMDYYGNTCVDVNSAIASYNFDAGFINCAAEKDIYYPSVFPMPAIVIAAGNYHTVIYQSITWYNADTLLIKESIDQFFSTVGLDDENVDESLEVYPNPAHDLLNIKTNVTVDEIANVAIYDMLGRKLDRVEYFFEPPILSLDISGLMSGNYLIELKGGGKLFRNAFSKN
jgi:hypothetical protein